MSFGSIVFTKKGKILHAKAQTGAQLTFTRLAMGDGHLTGQSETELTNLINKKKDIPITKLRPLNNGIAVIGGILNNNDLVQGFYWREIGLFANDPDVGEILYCYGNAGTLAEYISAGGSSEILEKQIDILAKTGNVANVTAVIDQSLVFLSMQDLEDHNRDVNSHPDIREAIENIEVPVKSVNGKTGAVELTASDITGLPTKLPADGGNADTVANKSASGTLSTTEKSNLVKAINEVFTLVSNGKALIAQAITDSGIIGAIASMTFAQLATKITELSTWRKNETTRANTAQSSSDFYKAKWDAVGHVLTQPGPLPSNGASWPMNLSSYKYFVTPDKIRISISGQLLSSLEYYSVYIHQIPEQYRNNQTVTFSSSGGSYSGQWLYGLK